MTRARLLLVLLICAGLHRATGRPAGKALPVPPEPSPKPLVIHVEPGDSDGDGIDDALEQRWLDAHRPLFKFNKGETVFPCSVTWFITHSDLVTSNGQRIARSELAKKPQLIFKYATGWRSFTGVKLDIADDSRPGPYQTNPKGSADVPLYGHAVRLNQRNALKYRGDAHTFGEGYVLLQYYWLFGYNDATKWDHVGRTIFPIIGGLVQKWTGFDNAGDHEGDWVWVDVILDRNEAPLFAIYHHHGDGNLAPSVVPWNEVEKDGSGPVAYVEVGVHELWPKSGRQEPISSPVHDHLGDGEAIKPNVVLNIGEAGRPMKQGNPEAQFEADVLANCWVKWGDFTGAGAGGNPPGPVQQHFPRPALK